jgi:hypothetical protein
MWSKIRAVFLDLLPLGIAYIKSINADQVLTVVRSIITVLGTSAATHGIITSDTKTMLLGGATVVVPVVWGIIIHSDQGKIAAVAAMPEVKQIVTTKAIADAAPSTKVTNGFVEPITVKGTHP